MAERQPPPSFFGNPRRRKVDLETDAGDNPFSSPLIRVVMVFTSSSLFYRRAGTQRFSGT